MKTLFIANATTRNHDLHYRIPENTRTFNRLIEAGAQIEIPETHRGQDALELIVKQLEAYGAVHRSKIKREEGFRFSGLVFSETPISEEAIRNGFTEDEQSAIDAAVAQHTKAAISADDKVARLAQESGTGVGSIEIQVAQDIKPGENPSGALKSLIQVDRPNRPKSERSQRQARQAGGR